MKKNPIIRLGKALGLIIVCYGLFVLIGMRSFKSTTYDSEIKTYSSSEVIRVTKQHLLPYRNELDLPTPNKFRIFIGWDGSVWACSLFRDIDIFRIILPEWKPDWKSEDNDSYSNKQLLSLLEESMGSPAGRPNWWFSSNNIEKFNYYEEHIEDSVKEKDYWIRIVYDISNSKIFVWVSFL